MVSIEVGMLCDNVVGMGDGGVQWGAFAHTWQDARFRLPRGKLR